LFVGGGHHIDHLHHHVDGGADAKHAALLHAEGRLGRSWKRLPAICSGVKLLKIFFSLFHFWSEQI